MTVQVFKSSDAGAPVLSGTAGAYNTILDAILGATGYNSKTITITRSGATATANCTSHGFTADQVLIISGAGESEYNITVNRPTIVDANNFSFPVAGTPATPATGTITCKVRGAGWTKSFTGTNGSSWLKPLGNQFYLDVIDTNTTYAIQRGYEAMTAFSTGTNPFPTAAQVATNSGIIVKSQSANATAVPWMAFVTGKTFYFWSVGNTGNTFTTGGNAGTQGNTFFGDILSENPGDAYATMCIGGETITDRFPFYTTNAAPTSGNYIARNNAQAAGSLKVGKFALIRFADATNVLSGVGTLTYPAPTNGGLILSPYVVAEASAVIFRGLFPGVWWVSHSSGLTPGDTFSGTGSFAGKKFILLASGSSASSMQAFEMSDTY